VPCRHSVVFAWSFKHLLILGSRVRVPPLSLLIFPRKPRVLQRIWGFFVGSASTSTSCFHGTISHPFAPKSTLRASASAVGARGRILATGQPKTRDRTPLHDRDCRATMGPQCRAVVLNCSRQELTNDYDNRPTTWIQGFPFASSRLRVRLDETAGRSFCS
jgi:hypothetical protein